MGVPSIFLSVNYICPKELYFVYKHHHHNWPRADDLHNPLSYLGSRVLPRLWGQGIVGSGGSITNISTETHGKLSVLEGERDKQT